MRDLVASGTYTSRRNRLSMPGYAAAAPRPHPVPVADLSTLEDEPQLVTARQAWAIIGVRPATLRKWVSRGYLQNVGHRGRAALYDRDDLERVRLRTQRRTNASPFWPQLRVPTHYFSRLITTAEAAKLLDVAPSTVRSWVTRGHLVPVRRSRRGHLFTTGSVLMAGRRTASADELTT
ncbi:helix-turn-helix domain-containing protein [Nocardia sp. Marseille-Q1738]